MENLTSYIIVSFVSFVAGFLLDLYLHRRADDRALHGVRQSRDFNSQLDTTAGQLQSGIDSAKASVSRSKARVGEMEEITQGIAAGTDKLNQSVERTAEHIEQAKGAAKTAGSSIAKIRALLAKAEERKKG